MKNLDCGTPSQWHTQCNIYHWQDISISRRPLHPPFSKRLIASGGHCRTVHGSNTIHVRCTRNILWYLQSFACTLPMSLTDRLVRKNPYLFFAHLLWLFTGF